MAEKQKKQKFKSPKGVAVWPKLNTPDTKFNPAGTYTIRLKVPAAEAEEFNQKLQAALDAVVEKAKANPKNKGKKLRVNDFYKVVVDDDGEETGEFEYNFKMTASGTRKDGTTWTQRPDLFDAKGEKLNPKILVYSGSVCKVAFEIVEYDKPATGCGISLRLCAVQVIKLVSGGGRNASSYAFGDESDDEDFEEIEQTTEVAETTEGSGSADDDEEF